MFSTNKCSSVCSQCSFDARFYGLTMWLPLRASDTESAPVHQWIYWPFLFSFSKHTNGQSVALNFQPNYSPFEWTFSEFVGQNSKISIQAMMSTRNTIQRPITVIIETKSNKFSIESRVEGEGGLLAKSLSTRPDVIPLIGWWQNWFSIFIQDTVIMLGRLKNQHGGTVAPGAFKWCVLPEMALHNVIRSYWDAPCASVLEHTHTHTRTFVHTSSLFYKQNNAIKVTMPSRRNIQKNKSTVLFAFVIICGFLQKLEADRLVCRVVCVCVLSPGFFLLLLLFGGVSCIGFVRVVFMVAFRSVML